MHLLTIDKLCKAFGGLKAICDLSFEVEQGEIIGLIGPNGSGKTTTLNLITGFVKPDSGKIIFRDNEITSFPRYRVCQKGIGRTFQLIKPFLNFTALQNVMVGRVYGQEHSKSLKLAREESKEILDRVGLLEKSNVMAKDLRLMERKRLELARALATRPQLLLLDELMAGLNHAETNEAMQLIKQIRDSGITIIVIEHIVKAILGLSDRIIVLNMGAKIAEASPQEIIHDPKVIEVYLGKAHA